MTNLYLCFTVTEVLCFFSIISYKNVLFLGHSLGAGVATLLGFLLRQRYPSLKVYAFATPGTYFLNMKFVSFVKFYLHNLCCNFFVIMH